MTPTEPGFVGVVRVDGTSLYVHHQRGEGTPVLLCNGIGANLELFDPVVDALVGEHSGRPVIRFDVPGTGGSPPVARPYRLRWLARLVLRLVEHLGYEQVDVLGISWGGALAQELACRGPGTVRRLVLCATSAGAIMVPARPSVLATLASPTRYFRPSRMHSTGARIYGGGFGDDPQFAREHAERTRAPHWWAYYQQVAAAAGWTSLPYLPLLKQPVLIVVGDDDPIVPLVNARLLSALLRDSRVHVVEGGGHLALLTHASEVGGVIGAFLS